MPGEIKTTNYVEFSLQVNV